MITMIKRTLMLRNSHFSVSTNMYLAKCSQSLKGKMLVYDTGYGFIVEIDEDRVYDRDDGIPADLIEVINYAQENDCNYIHFDCDADAIDDLPQYSWGA